MEPNNSYVNTYTKTLDEYFSRADAKVLLNSIYGMTSMSTNNVFLKKVIYNDPATIAFWSDGTKTIVKAQPGDTFDPEKGLAMVIAKKAFFGYNHQNSCHKCRAFAGKS